MRSEKANDLNFQHHAAHFGGNQRVPTVLTTL